jgi:Glycine cleavage system H protein (lipoate-binding)
MDYRRRHGRHHEIRAGFTRGHRLRRTAESWGGNHRQEAFWTVESVKAVSDLNAPASGTVTEVNEELATAPESVNKDAHAAWMLKIKIKDPAELNSLLSAADYEKFVTEEGGH